MEELIIEQATAVSQADVAVIAALGDVLHRAGTTAPTTPTTHDTAAMDALRQALEAVIAAENQTLLLARLDGKVVGMATLALLVGPIAGRKIYLDDFVTDPSVQGKGVGSRLWDAMLSWGQQHGAAKLTFTSNPKRQAAHRFYLHKGATIYNTTVFEKTIEQKSEL